MKYDFLIVGAGFAGAVCAERLASVGKRVLIIDRRSHVGGNAYDVRDENNLLVHPYGPHIFHTNSEHIFSYLSGFTNWRFYEHRVLSVVDGEFYPIPINRSTINRLYGLDLDQEGVAKFFERVREPRDAINTSEDVVLNSVGRDLCDRFFRGYTAKQWGLDLSELSAGVAARIPVRTNDDDRYFSDKFQFMPADGYTRMFERMLKSCNIDVRLSTDLKDIRDNELWGHMIYTGPIDSFYDCRFGKLPYRSIKFSHQFLPNISTFQPVGTVNYPTTEEFTRITEFKHLTGERSAGTSIVREFPCAEGDPYYPVPRPENEKLFKRYEALAAVEAHVTFVGRLAQYRYYNMDQVVGAALKVVERFLGVTR